MRVVLISGKAQSGKDTFSSMFKEQAEKDGKSVFVIRYADILKFVLKEYFGWNGLKDEEGRTMLQQVGTGLFRYNNPDVWVNCVIELVKGLGDKYDYVLIPDTRFKNEITKWNETSFPYYTVKIKRFNEDGTSYDNGLSEEQKNHSSETELDLFNTDYEVHNYKIEDFSKSVVEVYKNISSKYIGEVK